MLHGCAWMACEVTTGCYDCCCLYPKQLRTCHLMRVAGFLSSSLQRRWLNSGEAPAVQPVTHWCLSFVSTHHATLLSAPR
jgi:hypothetical protein